MAGNKVKVTYDGIDEARIPDELTEGATYAMDLRQRGVLESVAERLRIRRQGGYSGLDVWLLLLIFFTARAVLGVRLFCERYRDELRRVGPLAGRKSLPMSASLSRALNAVEPELLRSESTWLLAGASELDEVLRHPAVQSYDAQGSSGRANPTP